MKDVYSRRELFRLAVSVGGLGVLSQLSRLGLMNAFAQSSSTTGYKALVCIFLFGGNDSNNMVVPLDAIQNANYMKIRRNLALPQSDLAPLQTATQGDYGLHGQLKDFQPIFESGNMAIVANVGSLVAPLNRQQYLQRTAPVPDNLFSHADQQKQWQTSVPNGIARTGWAGRTADQIELMNLNFPSTFPAFVSVSGNTIMGTGELTRAATVIPNGSLGLKGFDKPGASQVRLAALQELLTLDSGATLIQKASQTMRDGLTDSSELAKALAGADPLPYTFPTTSIGQQLQQIARLVQVSKSMGMNRQIFFCSLGGFDTHTNQLADQDRLFSQLGPALAVFHQSMQTLSNGDQVVTFTESDFSRTLLPNTNGGTDHAWGSHHFVMGAPVKGGELYGSFPLLELEGPNDAGSEGRWIPTTSIDQYGATLAAWFGVAPNDLQTVFPNLLNFFPTISLGFV